MPRKNNVEQAPEVKQEASAAVYNSVQVASDSQQYPSGDQRPISAPVSAQGGRSVELTPDMQEKLRQAMEAHDMDDTWTEHRQWLLAEDEWPMQWPPGVAGELAKAMYCASYYPQQEISILSTLALLSGVAGRVYRTPSNATLSLYYILVAPTGAGKDALHDHVPALIRYSGMPAAEKFVTQEKFVSSQAIHRRLLESPGFLAMHTEFGKRLRKVASPKSRGGPDDDFVNILIEVYEKKFLDGVTRAKVDDSFPGVPWPALSFVGETTPQTFSGALTNEMMEDGFFSRFLTVVTTTLSIEANPEGKLSLTPSTYRAWVSLVGQALTLDSAPNLKPIMVEYLNADSKEKLEYFQKDCRKKFATADEKNDIYGVAAWNRAHIKALKVASLLAVADNPHYPKITLGHATWAIVLVRQEAHIFLDRVESGDVGDGDDVREKKVLEIFKRVIIGELKGGIPERNPQVVPRRIIQTNTSRLAPFKNHPLGAARALDATIKSLLDDGILWEMDKIKAAEEFGYQGRCFMMIRGID